MHWPIYLQWSQQWRQQRCTSRRVQTASNSPVTQLLLLHSLLSGGFGDWKCCHQAIIDASEWCTFQLCMCNSVVLMPPVVSCWPNSQQCRLLLPPGVTTQDHVQYYACLMLRTGWYSVWLHLIGTPSGEVIDFPRQILFSWGTFIRVGVFFSVHFACSQSLNVKVFSVPQFPNFGAFPQDKCTPHAHGSNTSL